MSVIVQIIDQGVDGFSVVKNDRGELAVQALVDAAVDEGGLSAVFELLYGLDQFFLCGHGMPDSGVAAGFRDLCEFEEVTGRGLAADGFVGAVIEDDMHELRCPQLADHGHGAHVHDGGGVPVQSNDMPVRLFKCDTQGDRGGMTHGADIQEVPGLGLPAFFAQEKEFACGAAGGRGIDSVLRHVVQNDFYRFFPAHGECGIDIIGFFGGRHNSLGGDEAVGSPVFCTVSHSFFNHLAELLNVISQDRIRDVHHIQELRSDLPLKLVLGVVGLGVSLAPPADEQEHGDSVDIGISQRGEGIDGIALAAVLHVDKGNLLCGKVVAGGDADGVSLVGGDDVPAGIVGKGVVAEAVQVGVRYAGEEGDAVVFQYTEYFFLV